MNEQIRQLTVQAGLVRVGDFGMKRWEGARSDSITDQDLEKFALLIVQKCADICQQYADGNYEVYNQILEHFGIEEE
jgi:hypothetical protein